MSALPHECNVLGCCTWHQDKAELTLGEFTIKHLTASGYECEKDHIHQRSQLCTLSYVCDNCDYAHDDEDDAQECCFEWQCTYCGYGYSDQHNAVYCCHTECNNCGEEGWPADLDQHECSHDSDCCECNECNESGTSMGTSTEAPWERRKDVKLTEDQKQAARQPGQTWQKTWGFEPKHHDPAKAACEYYVLWAIKEGVVGKSGVVGEVGDESRRFYADPTSVRIIQNEAQEAFDALVAEFAPVFKAYVNLAIGGELRHHTAIGGLVLPTSRARAWAGWAAIRAAVGAQALLDAHELFMEFGGGTYGGKNWADACSILHMYETGKLSDALFLDRVFNAQHNGGALLNKVSWACKNIMRWDVGNMQYTILPAHGAEPAPDYSTLLAGCGEQVRELFRTYWKLAACPGEMPRPKMPTIFIGNTPQTYEAQAKASVEQAKYYAKYKRQYLAYGPTPECNPYYSDYLYFHKNEITYWAEAVRYQLLFLIEGNKDQPSKVELHLKAWFEHMTKFKAQQAKPCVCWMCRTNGVESDEDGDLPIQYEEMPPVDDDF